MTNSDVQIILEHVDNRIDLVLEMIQVLAADVAEMKPQVALIPAMQADIATIKAVQVDQGREIRHMHQYLTAQGMPGRA